MMKKVYVIILSIVLIISIGFNVYLLNQGKLMEESLTNVSKELEELTDIVAEKDALLAESDATKLEYEKTIKELQKEIENLKEQITTLEKENEELTEQLKEPSKGSTAGGKGNTPTTSTANNPVPSSEGQLSDEEYNRLLQQYGITNGGSGLDTSGMDHGSGGAGWVLQ